MADSPMLLRPRAVLDGVLAAPLPRGGGVFVAELDAQTATVTFRAPARPALVRAFGEAYGADLPPGPKAVRAGGLTMVGITPRSFLAVREGGASLADELQARLGASAAVVDQSGGQIVLRVKGPHVRDAFAKGFTIDLHPDVFRPGDAATTTCAHVGVTLWRGEDGPYGPVYRIALFRSFALTFWHWLVSSAAEYGLERA